MKIKFVGLDTQHLDYSPGNEIFFDYLYTDLGANNDYYLRELKGNLIVHAGFTSLIDSVLEGHLEVIGKEKAKILLIDEIQEANDWESLKKAKTDAYGIQGVDFEKILALYESMTENGISPTYLATPLCPLEFNKDILDWAGEKGLAIIGLNPMGGWLSAARNIQTFTVPYLLGFAATYSDIVILSGRDIIKSDQSQTYLKGLIGTETLPMYSLKKNVSRPVKEIKKAVYTSMRLGEKYKVPYDQPEYALGDGGSVVKIGSYDTEYPEMINAEGEGLIPEVNYYLNLIATPTDGSQAEKLAAVRYKIIPFIAQYFEGYTLRQVRLGDQLLVLELERLAKTEGKWLWKTVTNYDLREFYIVKTPHGWVFNEENALEEEANPNIKTEAEDELPEPEVSENNN